MEGTSWVSLKRWQGTTTMLQHAKLPAVVTDTLPLHTNSSLLHRHLAPEPWRVLSGEGSRQYSRVQAADGGSKAAR